MMELFAWLESSALSTWVSEADTVWAYPTVLTLHTLGLGVLVGASAVVDLRLLGIAHRIPLGPMRSLFRFMWIGFWINAVTGSMLFAADAITLSTSALFMVKLAFVAVGVGTVVLIERHVYGARADPVVVSSTARRLAIASLVVWTAAIMAGRLLAYIK